jgi:hypothetical protein
MLAGKWYALVSYVFSHEFDLPPADTGGFEKEVAFFDGLRWYATLSPFA